MGQGIDYNVLIVWGGCAMLLPSIWLLVVAVALPQTSEGPGTKITTRSGPLGNSHDRTVYLQADRERLEYTNSVGGKHTIYGPGWHAS
jgi:hypothetical protein